MKRTAVALLHQDSDWLVVDKPCGMSTHAPRPGELGLVEWLQLHLGLKTHIVSRLDRGTSGVLLLAKHAESSRRAQEIHESGQARKIYTFLSPVDARQCGHQDQWVTQNELDGRPAETIFRRLGSLASSGMFQYEAEINRGRRHQIRRHAAAANIPILGDREYGGQRWGRLCLHCQTVHWPGISQPIYAPDPHGFQSLARTGASSLDQEFAVCRDRRGALLPLVTDAFRAVHRDEIAGLPVAVDIYGSWFDAVWFDEDSSTAEAADALAPLLELVTRAHACRGGMIRTHRRDPHHRSLVTETTTIGDPPPKRHVIAEHGLRFQVGLNDSQHSGLFLDQRDTRRRVALASACRRLANLFAYTCSFSVAAVAAGAEVAFSVDVAKPALSRGMVNFELNELSAAGRGKFIQEDARRWLRRQLRKVAERPAESVPLDLAVCDPPVFAGGGKGKPFSVEKEWPFLAGAVAALLKAGGQAIFANNHRTGSDRFYRGELSKHFTEVTDLRPPLDFPELPEAPSHVRTFWCRK